MRLIRWMLARLRLCFPKRSLTEEEKRKEDFDAWTN